MQNQCQDHCRILGCAVDPTNPVADHDPYRVPTKHRSKTRDGPKPDRLRRPEILNFRLETNTLLKK